MSFTILTLAALVGFLAGLSQGGGGFLIALLTVPVLFLTNILYLRLVLEFILNVARIAENTERD